MMARHVRPDTPITGDPGKPLPELLKAMAAELAVRDGGLDIDEARARAEIVFSRHLADAPSAETMNRIVDEIIADSDTPPS